MGMSLEDSLPYVSVVIPTYCREEILCRTICELSKQDYPSFEIIVVDQSPQHKPSTEECLRRLASCNAIRYYRLHRPSLPAARNFGVRQAAGEIVLFVDDDISPSTGLIASHAVEYSDPSVGGVAGSRSFPPSATITEGVEPVGSVMRNLETRSNFSSPKRHSAVEWASGCNVSCRKELFSEVGGFEPCFIGSAVFEDVDFCFRLRRRGYRIVYSPEAHLVHLLETAGGCGNRHIGLRYYYGWFHNSMLFTFRHMSLSNWPFILWHRLFVSLALVKQYRAPYYTLALAVAILHAVGSYFRSLKSLRAVATVRDFQD